MDTITVSRALTTPSNLQRRKLCPGSARMEKGCTDNDTADARRGRLFHRYWTNPNYERGLLTPDERDLLVRSDQLYADVLGVLNLGAPSVTRVEETITGLSGRLTGTPDMVNVWRTAALVTDLKSGFAVVERAELNLQLRGYSVLVNDNAAIFDGSSGAISRGVGAATIYVAILQPRLWSPSERVTLAQYTADDASKAAAEINNIIDRTEDPKAPLVAGEEQCRYCKAKLICPAFRKAVGMPLAKFKTEEALSKAKREAEIERRVKRCNDAQLEKLYSAVKIARIVDDIVTAECRARIKANRFTNFELGKDYEVRNVKNVRRAIALLALSGVATREEVIDHCALPIRSLEDMLRAKHKGMTWQQARDKIDRVLKSVLEREPRDAKILPKKTTTKRK
jgi:Protein of unknown function (DUF2800)